MHDVYQQSNERFIEEERPRVVQAASSSHNNPNMGLPYPYDPDDNEIDNKETYFTNVKGKELNLSFLAFNSFSWWILRSAFTTEKRLKFTLIFISISLQCRMFLINLKDFFSPLFGVGDASSLNAGSLPTCHSSLVVLTISTSLLLFNYLFKFNYALTRLDSSWSH